MFILIDKDNLTVLDTETGELEKSSKSDLKKALNLGIAIDGLDLRDDKVVLRNEAKFVKHIMIKGRYKDDFGYEYAIDDGKITLVEIPDEKGIYIKPFVSKIDVHFENKETNGVVFYGGSGLEDMTSCFNCYRGSSINIRNMDLSNVITLASAFCDCGNLRSLDLSGVDLHSVQSLFSMCNNCQSLESVDLSNIKFDSLTVMENTFLTCHNLKSLNLKGSYFGNVKSVMNLFAYCDSLEEFKLSDFGFTSELTNISNLFHNCFKLTKVDVSGVDTSNVWSMGGMFNGCTSLEEINLEGIDTSSVDNMDDMFYKCEKIKSLDLSNFDVEELGTMNGMFAYCTSLKELDISNFNLSNCYSMSEVFRGCTSLESLKMEEPNYQLEEFECYDMFGNCREDIIPDWYKEYFE